MPRRPKSIDPLLALRILCALAVLGAIGLVLASFLPVLRLSAADPSALRGRTASYTGLDRHSISLIMIALVAVAATALAARGMRIAAFAVLLCALASLLIAVGLDLHDLQQSGTLGADVVLARLTAGSGYYIETVSAVMLLLSGGGLVGMRGRAGLGGRGVDERRPVVDDLVGD